MARFIVHYAGRAGWSGWIFPRRRGYRLGCCDCGLVHDIQFRLQGRHILFRARRNNRSTALMRRKR